MAGRLWPLAYPLLFAAALVLGVAAGSPGQYRATDLALVLAGVLLAAAFVVLGAVVAVRAFGRSDRAAPLAAALAMLAIAWLLYFLPAQRALRGVSHRLAGDRVLVPLAILATAVAVVWLARQPQMRLLALSAFMTRFGLFLLAIVGVQAAAEQRHGPRLARRSALARELAEPVPISPVPLPAERNTPQRDIYLIVLDGHANARVLQEVFDFDNSPFEDSLRALGFLVPRDVRSNYVQTYLSVSSLLNFAHVTRLTQDAGVASKDHSLPTYLVKHNRAARFLKRQGYKYVLFPSAWWAPTANSPLADQEFDPRPAFDLGYEMRRTELRLAVLRSSLLRFAFDGQHAETPMVEQFLRTFRGLQAMPMDSTPTFAFAHILLPHVPYLVDGTCRPLARIIRDDEEADTPVQRAAYLGQVRCADRLVLELATSLLRRSATPPVILVVGDHGPRFTDVGFYGHPERVSTAFLRERFGAFGAFYLPAGGDSVFHEPVTLVNVLGHVLRYYFNAVVPPQSDDMFVSGEQPYRFVRVEPGVLDGRRLPARAGRP